MKALQGAKSRVLNTKDYSLFRYTKKDKFFQRRLTLLIDEMEIKNLSKDLPIIVDEEYNILDGVYRFEANKALNAPIYYKISEVSTLLDLMKAGTLTHVPTEYEFLLFHKEKIAYRKILEWNKILPYSLKDIVSVMETNWLRKQHRINYRAFQNGNMIYTKKDDFVFNAINKFITELTEKFGFHKFSIDGIVKLLKDQKFDWSITKCINTISKLELIHEFLKLNDEGHPSFQNFAAFVDESLWILEAPDGLYQTWHSLNMPNDYTFPTLIALHKYLELEPA